ncbi:MAG: flippase [Ruminococcus sp.]|nr:flippase [Ruminococcus sp.]
MANSSIKKNFMYQMIYEVLVMILPFVTSPYISRVVGAEGLGVYTYSYSIAFYFVLFSMLGLKNYGNRAIAMVRDDKKRLNETFSNIVTLHFIVSVICFAVYIGYIIMMKGQKIYAIIQIGYVLSGLLDISWFYFGIEKFKMTVARSTAIRILNVVCIFVFVHEESDLWKYCLIMSAGMFLSSLILWIPLKKYVSFVKPEPKKMIIHLKPMLILFIPAIAVSLYKYMDKIMIGSLSNKIQLGFYENAEKVNTIPLTVISSFGTVMMPKMSNLAARSDKQQANKYMGLSMQFVMCLSFALAFGLAGVGKVFAPVFWGDEFVLSGTLIMALSITVPFISFANILRTQYLIPNEKDKDYIVSVASGAVINLIVNALLIPKHGAIGATIGTVLAEVTVCVIQTWSVRKALPLGDYFKSFAVFAPIGAVMFAAVFTFGNMMGCKLWVLIAQIAIGVAVYCVFAHIYFVKTKNEFYVSTINTFKKKLRH